MGDTGGGWTCSAKEDFQRYLPSGGGGGCGDLDGELSRLVVGRFGRFLWMDGFFFNGRGAKPHGSRQHHANPRLGPSTTNRIASLPCNRNYLRSSGTEARSGRAQRGTRERGVGSSDVSNPLDPSHRDILLTLY